MDEELYAEISNSNKHDKKLLFEGIIDGVKKNGFDLKTKNIGSENYLDLIFKTEEAHFNFSIDLLAKHNLQCCYYGKVNYPVLSDFIADLPIDNRLTKGKHWSAFTTVLGKFLSKRYTDQYASNSPTGYRPEYPFSESGINQAVYDSIELFFKKGMLAVMDETKTLKKADHLINDGAIPSLKNGKLIVQPHSLYTSLQTILGTFLACFLEREDRQELVELYAAHSISGNGYPEDFAEILYATIRHYVKTGILSSFTPKPLY